MCSRRKYMDLQGECMFITVLQHTIYNCTDAEAGSQLNCVLNTSQNLRWTDEVNNNNYTIKVVQDTHVMACE